MKSRKHHFPVYISLTDEQYAMISCCASDLGVAFETVLEITANTALRVHLDRCKKRFSDDEFEEDAE